MVLRICARPLLENPSRSSINLAHLGHHLRVFVARLLTTDRDRGRVFAHLAGTLELRFASERQQLRGDIALLNPQERNNLANASAGTGRLNR